MSTTTNNFKSKNLQPKSLQAVTYGCRFNPSQRHTAAANRSLTTQAPRHRLPRTRSGKCEQKIVDATPALELAVLTRCEYAKPRKPVGEEHRPRNV